MTKPTKQFIIYYNTISNITAIQQPILTRGHFRNRKMMHKMDKHELLCLLNESTALDTFLYDTFTAKGTIFSLGLMKWDQLEIPDYVLASPSKYIWHPDKYNSAYLNFSTDSDNEYKRNFLSNISLATKKGLLVLRTQRTLAFPGVPNEFDLVSVLYVLEGKLYLTIDGIDISLSKGNVLIHELNTPFYFKPTGAKDTVISIVIRKDMFSIYFSNLMIGDGLLNSFFCMSFIPDTSSKYLIINAPPDDEIASLMLDILIAQEDGGRYSTGIVASSIQFFLFKLATYYEKEFIFGKEPSKLETTALSIINFMRENYADISINDISKHFLFSTAYVSRVLNKQFGNNYIGLLTEIRIKKAKQLLTIKNLSIEQISHMIGYSNPRQFRRVFRETFGVSPSEYRIDLNPTDDKK